MVPLPGQKPTLLTSCEYASFVMGSAPGRSGARRPENLVTAKSKLPQKKCTGLHLPMNHERNSSKTACTLNRIRQKLCAASGSYDACTRSSSNGIGLGI